MVAEQGVVSREQYEEFRANLDTLNANVGSARAAVNSAAETIKVDTAAAESAKVQLSYCFIRSPIDGRAGQRLVDMGNVVNPGGPSGNTGSNGETADSANGLLVIERLDPIYADFTISQNSLVSVQQQMQAGRLRTEVRLPDTPGEPVIGQLTFLNNAVADTTGTVNLRATIPNSGHTFWPGRFVNIRLVLNTIHQAVLVLPQRRKCAKGSSSMWLSRTRSRTTASNTRPRQGRSESYVENGVAAGESVVYPPANLGVAPGGKVHIEKPASPAAAGNEASGAK